MPRAAEVAVIAALDRERQLDAERVEQVGRPRPERHHRGLGIDRPFRGVDAPAAGGLVQPHGVALHHDPAQRLESGDIGLRHRERIGDARRVLPEHGVTKHRGERRLEGARGLGVEHAQRHAELRRDGALARRAGEARVAAIELEPAGVAHVALGARLGHQRFVLADRAGEQRPHRLHGLDEALRRGIAAERDAARARPSRGSRRGSRLPAPA